MPDTTLVVTWILTRLDEASNLILPAANDIFVLFIVCGIWTALVVLLVTLLVFKMTEDNGGYASNSLSDSNDYSGNGMYDFGNSQDDSEEEDRVEQFIMFGRQMDSLQDGCSVDEFLEYVESPDTSKRRQAVCKLRAVYSTFLEENREDKFLEVMIYFLSCDVEQLISSCADVVPIIYAQAKLISPEHLQNLNDRITLPLVNLWRYSFKVEQSVTQALTRLVEEDLLSNEARLQIVPIAFNYLRAYVPSRTQAGDDRIAYNNSRPTVASIVQTLVARTEAFDKQWYFNNVVPSFSHLLQDTSPGIRRTALAALAVFSNFFGQAFTETCVVPHLKRCASDSNDRVRRMVLEILAQVAKNVTKETRSTILVDIFQLLLCDRSKDISRYAMIVVGHFAMTFADPRVTSIICVDDKLKAINEKEYMAYAGNEDHKVVCSQQFARPDGFFDAHSADVGNDPNDSGSGRADSMFSPDNSMDKSFFVNDDADLDEDDFYNGQHYQAGADEDDDEDDISVTPKANGTALVIRKNFADIDCPGLEELEDSSGTEYLHSDGIFRSYPDKHAFKLPSSPGHDSVSAAKYWSTYNDSFAGIDEELARYDAKALAASSSVASQDSVLSKAVENLNLAGLSPPTDQKQNCSSELNDFFQRRMLDHVLTPATPHYAELDNEIDDRSTAITTRSSETTSGEDADVEDDDEEEDEGGSHNLLAVMAGLKDTESEDSTEESFRQLTIFQGEGSSVLDVVDTGLISDRTFDTLNSSQYSSRSSMHSPRLSSSEDTRSSTIQWAILDKDERRNALITHHLSSRERRKVKHILDNNLLPPFIYDQILELGAPDLNNEEIAMAAAQTIPGIVLVFGQSHWLLIKSVYCSLSTHRSPAVKRIMAKSLKDVAFVLGPRIAEKDLFKVFECYFNNRIHGCLDAMLPSLRGFVQACSESTRHTIFSNLGQYFNISELPYRQKSEFAKQCTGIVPYLTPDDINKFISGYALALMDDRIHDVRTQGCKLLAAIIANFITLEWPKAVAAAEKANADDEDEGGNGNSGATDLLELMSLTKNLLIDTKKSFSQSTVWRRRQAWGFVLQHMFASITHEQYLAIIAAEVLAFAKDPIPNNRMLFCKIIQELWTSKEFAELSDLRVQQLHEALLTITEIDKDFSVLTTAHIVLGFINVATDTLAYEDWYATNNECQEIYWKNYHDYRAARAATAATDMGAKKPSITDMLRNKLGQVVHSKFNITSVPEHEQTPPARKPNVESFFLPNSIEEVVGSSDHDVVRSSRKNLFQYTSSEIKQDLASLWNTGADYDFEVNDEYSDIQATYESLQSPATTSSDYAKDIRLDFTAAPGNDEPKSASDEVDVEVADDGEEPSEVLAVDQQKENVQQRLTDVSSEESKSSETSENNESTADAAAEATTTTTTATTEATGSSTTDEPAYPEAEC